MADKYGQISDINDDEADVCILAVSDSALDEVATQLAFAKTMLVHTAGSVSLNIIEGAAADRAVLWPVYSILKHSMPDHRNIPCGWEASTKKAAQYVQEIGHGITDMLFEAKYEQRKWMHLSAVISNNFVNHLLGICEQICAENELPFSALTPIIEQTFDRIKHASPKLLQTGPAARHDEVTINAQKEILTAHPEWQRVYEAITASIQGTSAL